MNKLTQKEFEDRIANRFPQETFVVVSYSGIGSPGEIRCASCGQIISVGRAGNFLAKNKVFGCRSCHDCRWGREVKWAEVEKRYTVELFSYAGTHRSYKLTCKKCGAERVGTFGNLYRHISCRCEGQKNDWTVPELNARLINRYIVLADKVQGISYKTDVRCVRCGRIWNVRIADILYSNRGGCPSCRYLDKQSLGEAMVERCLDTLGVKYEREVFLKNSLQRFDFFIPSFNTAIEYNGAQHYRYTEMFHENMDGFLSQLERDRRKARYCQANGINLLVIPYSWKEDKVSHFLTDKLCGSTTIA